MKITDKRIIGLTIIIILVAFVICFLMIYGFFRFVITLDNYGPTSHRSPVNIADFSDSGSYKIDTKTILKSIGSGQSPLFLPETVQTPESSLNGKLEWNQSEYLKVVEKLFEFQWKEPLSKDWSVDSMGFDRVCDDNPAGFEYASFIFHHPSKGANYEARLIEISLSDGTISWGSGGGYPQLPFETSKPYLSDLKITADDALNIAEKKWWKGNPSVCQKQLRFEHFFG